MIIAGELNDGQTLRVDAREEEITFKVTGRSVFS
jgi:hypothetical protein